MWTADGVTFILSLFWKTRIAPISPSQRATQEFVVPKSIPKSIVLVITFPFTPIGDDNPLHHNLTTPEDLSAPQERRLDSLRYGVANFLDTRDELDIQDFWDHARVVRPTGIVDNLHVHLGKPGADLPRDASHRGRLNAVDQIPGELL
jgi:hypothetical protein